MAKAESRNTRKIVVKALKVAGVALLAFMLLYPLAIEPWYLRWGATDAEIKAALPGDNVAQDPRIRSTRAITIKAPADKVWPWLVQMGQGRGGLYSYDWLENLAGCDMHSANRIHPEWQDLKVGDTVRFGREDTTRLIVRSNYDWKPSTGNFIMWRVVTAPLHFIMERKMLFGIKTRAEGKI